MAYVYVWQLFQLMQRISTSIYCGDRVYTRTESYIMADRIHTDLIKTIHTYTQHGARINFNSYLVIRTAHACARSNILFTMGKLKFALLGNFHPCFVLRAPCRVPFHPCCLLRVSMNCPFTVFTNYYGIRDLLVSPYVTVYCTLVVR